MVGVAIFAIIKTDKNWTNKHNEEENYISNSLDIDHQNTNMQYFFDEMNRQDSQEFAHWPLEESRKSVTPFEHGGYDMNNNHNMSGF